MEEVIENVDYQLLLTRKKILKDLEQKEKVCVQRQKRLSEREAKETEEKKKRMEEDEENKYEYGNYSHTNRMGLGIKKKPSSFKTTKTIPSTKTTKTQSGSSAVGLNDKIPTKRKTTVGKR